MISSPFVSIVMVNYNGSDYLKRSIFSVVSQKYPNFEFIVVDNSSIDDSKEIVSLFPSIILVENNRIAEKNYGCNLGVSKAKGEYLLILDNDVILPDPYFIKRSIAEFSFFKNIGQMGFVLINEFQKKTNFYGMFYGLFFVKELKKRSYEEIKKSKPYPIGFATGAIFLMKKNVWNQVGGYDDHLSFGGDDSDLGIKLYTAGYINYLNTNELILHIGIKERTDTIKYARKFRKIIFANIYTILKNFRTYNVIIYLPFYLSFIFIKTIKESFVRRSFLPLFAMIFAFFDLFTDFSHIYNSRYLIQKNRIIKEDVYLSIQNFF